MAEWTAAYINRLPDSSFAFIEPGGEKDGEGKTTPRSLRHFPIRDASGTLDADHVRNALARLSQSPFERQARPKVEAAARSLGIGEPAQREAADVNLHLLRAVEAAIADELTTLPAVAEAGRVFSAANEQQLRAVAQAINSLLALVQQAPVAPDAGAASPPPPGGAPAPVPVRQSVAPTLDGSAMLVQEAVVPLAEAAKGGKGLIKAIDAGWGTSGFYSKDVLARDAAVAFPAGTKMYWDHPTLDEAKSRPERSIRDLAAETTGPAGWMDDGPEGPGVYAPVSIFSGYRPAIDELRDHIGTSIRSYAEVRNGEADGKRGPLIERLLPSPTNSIDFVTIPGRGGRVAALFEAARGQHIEESEGADVSEAEVAAAKAAQAAAEKRADEADERAARAETAAAVVAAASAADEALRTVAIPDAAKAAVRERAIANPPIKDGALDREAFVTMVTAEAAKEKAYIDRLTGKGEVRGMGAGDPAPAAAESAETQAAMVADFQRMGLSESAAKVAAVGRTV